MDVNRLIEFEEFFDCNCIAIGSSKLLGFTIIDNRLLLGADLNPEMLEITDIGRIFSKSFAGSIFSGGGSAGHGSCGHFSKSTGGMLDWMLFCTYSDPFFDVEIIDQDVRFVSQSGDIWTVHGGCPKQISLSSA